MKQILIALCQNEVGDWYYWCRQGSTTKDSGCFSDGSEFATYVHKWQAQRAAKEHVANHHVEWDVIEHAVQGS